MNFIEGIEYVIQPYEGLTAVNGILAGLGFAVCVAALVHVVWKRLRDNLIAMPHEPRFAEHLPFLSSHGNGAVVRCKRDIEMAVWRLEGLDHGGRTTEERIELNRNRAAGLARMAKSEAQIRFITVRERLDRSEERIDSEKASSIVSEINRRWREHVGQGLFYNEHYLVASVRTKRARGSEWEEIEQALETAFSSYRPKRLDASTWPHTPLSPYRAIAAPASSSNPRIADGENLSEILSQDLVVVSPNAMMEFHNAGKSVYSVAIGIRGIATEYDESVMLRLMRTQGQIIIGQSLTPISDTRAMGDLSREARVARGNESEENPDYLEIMQILQGSHESEQQGALYEYCMTILCQGESEEEARTCAKRVDTALTVSGMTARREGYGAQAAYWHLMPSWPIPPRPWRFLSNWIAPLVTLQSAPPGIEKHDWHEQCVTPFRNAEGGRYGFTFHPTGADQEAGHCVVVGRTGGGKTTLVSHLAYSTLAIPGARVWMFDRHNGAEVAVRSAGGIYVKMSGDERARMNPLLMEDTNETRLFLTDWLASLGGDDTTSVDRRNCERAVRVAMEHLPPEQRTIENLHATAFRENTAFAERLGEWATGNRAHLFNGEQDDFSGWDNPLIAFDCTRVLENEETAAAVVSYLMYRIRLESMLRPGPTLIYIDEAEPMLNQPAFRPMYKKMLLEGRKLHQVTVSCFQRASVIEELNIEDLVLGQCRTAILLRNAGAEEKEYDRFKLSRSERDFVMGTSHEDIPHAALIKRYDGHGTTIIDTDLRPLGAYLKIYSSASNDVASYREHAKANGDVDAGYRYIGQEREERQ